ncbi:MAG TPA: alpha/beta hydrolase [Solirubrobacterales bacterium]|nr:alpha/beta hydrolase [Solirubrobacterales bacterium]
MGRGWKILIGIVAAVAVLLALNTVVTDDESKSAEVNEPGGRILHLSGGDIQAVEKGPRSAPPIVLVHCFSCAINWWNRMMPRLDRTHRVIAVDLLGHGGSEKPTSGYTIPNQADLVAQAMARLGVRDAEVVGHSLGGSVVTALAERSPQLVERVVIIDTAPTHRESSLGLLANAAFAPVIGQALWRIKPDFAVRKGLEVAFAPGFDVPDEFVEDVKRMTYDSYHDSPDGSDEYSKEEGLDRRMKESGKPLLVIMGAEEQIIDEPAARLAEYRRTYPGTQTKLIQGAGHSPNVEKPAQTAALVLAFDKREIPAKTGKQGAHAQDGLQKTNAVRGRP